MQAHPNSVGVECLLTMSQAGWQAPSPPNYNNQLPIHRNHDANNIVSQDIFDMLAVSDEGDFEGF